MSDPFQEIASEPEGMPEKIRINQWDAQLVDNRKYGCDYIRADLVDRAELAQLRIERDSALNKVAQQAEELVRVKLERDQLKSRIETAVKMGLLRD